MDEKVAAAARKVLADAIDRMLAQAPEAAAQFQQQFGANTGSAAQWVGYALTQQGPQVWTVLAEAAPAPPVAPPAPAGGDAAAEPAPAAPPAPSSGDAA